MIFNPSAADVRRFFCTAWQRHRRELPLEPLQSMALDWIIEHPEYHALLDDEQAALNIDTSADTGRSNPFLHLSMHLALAEQLSIDQPPGIRAAVQALVGRTGSMHAAAHEAIEALGETLWEAQRAARPPDSDAYLRRLRQRAGLNP